MGPENPAVGRLDSKPPSSSAIPHKQVRFLLWIVLFSVLCRLILLTQKEVVGTDEVIYLALGQSLWQGQGLTLEDRPVTMCPPLLPIVAGIFSLFTEDLEKGTNFTYWFFGGLLVLPYFFFARRIYGDKVAKLACFFLAFYPGLLLAFYWGSMTEHLYTFVLVSAFLFCLRAVDRGSPADFAWAGGLLALVYLTRSEGVLFFPVLLAWTAMRTLRGTSNRRRALARLAVMAVCFAVVSAPYPLFLKKHSGELSISGKTKLILLAGAMDLQEREKLLGKLNEEGTDFFNYEELVRDKTVLGMVLENPKVLVGGSLLQFRNFFVALFSWKVFPAFLLPFVVLGLFRRAWNRERLRKEVFLATVCLPFLVFLTFQIWPRYLLPITPILLLWAVRGVVELEEWIEASARRIRENRTLRHPRPWFFVPRVLAAILLLAILVAKPVKARMLDQMPVEYRTAGLWMKENLPPQAIILARKPEVAYYAQRRMRPLPNEELPRILRYALAQKAEYMVVDEAFIATRPQLAGLLASEEPPPPLERIYETRSPSGRKLRVFRIDLGQSGSPWPGGAGP